MTASRRFGRFELRPSNRQLLVDGPPAVLGARAFDVLVALVERPDRLVPKAELLELAWPGRVDQAVDGRSQRKRTQPICVALRLEARVRPRPV